MFDFWKNQGGSGGLRRSRPVGNQAILAPIQTSGVAIPSGVKLKRGNPEIAIKLRRNLKLQQRLRKV
jgi:hypothetical protein